ncbi:hypothetical protein FHL15_001886 [Xylaria flabelliformis]|uniref:Uncharacterized protein n=1 Tax=Xylaria flabelliformis TaxID=2512241 RepID=A0A553IA70_9PEZI|nr:hypothetical protein FHL15_001886 [Xylaria flabelliformis]
MLAVDSSQWHDLGRTIDRNDIMDYYGDLRSPIQLRLLGLAVLRRGIASRQTYALMEALRIRTNDSRSLGHLLRGLDLDVDKTSDIASRSLKIVLFVMDCVSSFSKDELTNHKNLMIRLRTSVRCYMM